MENMIYLTQVTERPIGICVGGIIMDVKQFWNDVLAQDRNAIRKYFRDDAYVN